MLGSLILDFNMEKNWLICNNVLQVSILKMGNYRVSHTKGIDKKRLVGAANGFISLFLNLFGFSVSVSFVWCII